MVGTVLQLIQDWVYAWVYHARVASQVILPEESIGSLYDLKLHFKIFKEWYSGTLYLPVLAPLTEGREVRGPICWASQTRQLPCCLPLLYIAP